MIHEFYNEMRSRGWLVDVGNIYHRIRNAEGQQQRVTLRSILFAIKAVNGFIFSLRMLDEEKMKQEKRSLQLVRDSFRKLLIVGEHTKSWIDKAVFRQ